MFHQLSLSSILPSVLQILHFTATYFSYTKDNCGDSTPVRMLPNDLGMKMASELSAEAQRLLISNQQGIQPVL